MLATEAVVPRTFCHSLRPHPLAGSSWPRESLPEEKVGVQPPERQWGGVPGCGHLGQLPRLEGPHARPTVLVLCSSALGTGHTARLQLSPGSLGACSPPSPLVSLPTVPPHAMPTLVSSRALTAPSSDVVLWEGQSWGGQGLGAHRTSPGVGVGPQSLRSQESGDRGVGGQRGQVASHTQTRLAPRPAPSGLQPLYCVAPIHCPDHSWLGGNTRGFVCGLC